MEINEKSWHYYAVDSIFEDHNISESLCIYFWQVVWSIIMLIGMGGVLAIISLTVFIFVAAYWTTALGLFVAPPFPFFLVSGVVNALILFAVIRTIIFDSPIRGSRFMMWWNENVERKVRSVKTTTVDDSILYQYIKAKKEKICPRIDFVRD